MDEAVKDAIRKIEKAIYDVGPNRQFHRQTMERHRREWPTLWEGIDALLRGRRAVRERPGRVVNVADTAVRVENGWWCEEHQEMHLGPIESWTMEHRRSLHPLFVHWRTDVSDVPGDGIARPIGPDVTL